MPMNEKVARASYVVENSGSLEKTHLQLEDVAKKIHPSNTILTPRSSSPTLFLSLCNLFIIAPILSTLIFLLS